jgi:hypothetical protein
MRKTKHYSRLPQTSQKEMEKRPYSGRIIGFKAKPLGTLHHFFTIWPTSRTEKLRRIYKTIIGFTEYDASQQGKNFFSSLSCGPC